MKLHTFILYLIFTSIFASCNLNGKGKKGEGASSEKDTSLTIPEMPSLTKDYIRRQEGLLISFTRMKSRKIDLVVPF